MRRSHVVAALTLVTMACGRTGEPVEPAVEVQHAQAGDTITLRFGASAQIGNSVYLRFRAVEADSRCPINALCVWPGDAVVRIEAARVGEAWQPLTLHTYAQPRQAAFGGFTIELIEVAPPRTDPDSPRPRDYSVRLAISRG